jgi:hypothetical protein
MADFKFQASRLLLASTAAVISTFLRREKNMEHQASSIKQMGTFCPDFSSGGTMWFTDLAAADPNLILPLINAASFLLMFELNSEGFQTQVDRVEIVHY